MARPSIVQFDTNESRKENMIDHVILTVSDFKRSVAFYAKASGITQNRPMRVT